MKKITLMLLAMFAAVTVSAQTGPMKASKLGESTSIDDLVGWTYWYHRTTSHEPVSDNNARNEIAKDVYNAETNPTGTTRTGGRYVVFTKVDESNIKIYGMFECPLDARVTFNKETGKIYNIIIPCDQVVSQDSEYGDIYLTQTTWVQSLNDNAGGWHTYEDVRLYFGFNSNNNEYYWYVSNNWIQLYYMNGDEKVQYGGNYIPSATYCYAYLAKNLSVVQYADWNALMYVTFDKSVQDYTNTTYCVNVTQEGDVVKVENFNGGGTTVNIDLKSGNKLGIEHQTGMFGTTEYTYYPAIGGGLVGPDMENIIEGTGTEDELTWGDYCRHSDFATYQYSSGKIIFLNKDVNKFVFPENDPTAIQDVETATDENAAALEYNLAGQRVGKDYKGIVVKNGKKMIKF